MISRWHSADVAFLRSNYGALTPSDCAIALGRTVIACRVKASVLAIRRRRRRRPIPNALTKALLTTIATEIGCSPADILGASQARKFVVARWRVARTLRDEGYSLPGIGRQMGRDHTTILTGLRSLAALEIQ